IIAFSPDIPLQPWEDFPEGEIVSGTRKHSGHVLFEDKARGLSAGVWEQGANESRWVDYPVNEFMTVLEGEVVIIEEDRSVSIKAGESFIIPKGLRCRWTQPGHVRKFFVIFDDPSGARNTGPLRTIKIDPQVPLSPSAPPAAAMLLSPVPEQHSHDYFTDATGQLQIGVWSTTGYRRKLIDFPRHELMCLLEGSVTFEDDNGHSRRFSAGSTFFVPQGTPNSWTSEGYLKKIFVIFAPAS
ncbi:cupin domain-containing protein, partial [Aestuariivirga sp.]|uniref:cupin domain-containing protein n=1 Tax=Aestuariivirga sp. TaxID=2650926 RepID=UPI0037848D39